MPDYDLRDDPEAPESDDPNERIIKQALDDFKEAKDGDQDRELRKADLRFTLGDSDNNWQWPDELLRARQNPGQPIRPCLTINKTAEHVRQVTNDQRQNKPSIKVRPANDKARPDAADVYAGIIRNIEYASNAQSAYNTACDHQVPSGLGYFRILTEYCDDNSFDQDLRITRVLNPYTIWDDPFIQTPEGSDRRYAFIAVDIPTEQFKQEYPGAVPANWPSDDSDGWVSKDSVRIAEYYYYQYTKRELWELATGAVVFADEATPEMANLVMRRRQVTARQVRWCKLTAFSILDQQDLKGQYIPLIRVVGDEYMVDGERVIKGLTRNAKDPQRLFNYYRSSEAEVIGQQPKAPYVGYVGQFEGHAEEWKTANVTGKAYLEVNLVGDPATGQALPLPQRQPPPVISAAFVQGAANASDDIKSATGQYDASLGARSNETSGIAIQRRQQEGDVSTYHYGDNLANGIRFGGVILVDLIPLYYGKRKVARILGEDGKDSFVRLNSDQQEAVESVEGEDGAIEKIYNLSVGKYDVAITVGPSYTTKRLESQDFMTSLAQAYPDIMAKAGDIVIRNFDVAGAEMIADRLKKFLPPQVTAGETTGQQDPNQIITELQQQQQMLEQGLQQAEQLYTQVQEQLKQLSEENSQLKVANANKSGEIEVKRDKVAADLMMEQMRAEAQENTARIEAAVRRFEAVTAAITQQMQPPAQVQ